MEKDKHYCATAGAVIIIIQHVGELNALQLSKGQAGTEDKGNRCTSLNGTF